LTTNETVWQRRVIWWAVRRVLPVLLIGLVACATPRATGPATAPEQPATAEVAAPDSPDPADLDELVQGPAGDDLDDGVGPDEAGPPVERPPHPLVDLSDEELEAKLLEDPESLGPISLGRTSSGALFNGVQMPEGDQWNVVNPRETWGTQETVDALIRCIKAVNDQFPNTPPVNVGDISDKNGGHLRPHISHQSGRDVDVGFYYKDSTKWYVTADGSNLDLPRTWAFVRAMITETDVQWIFIDRKIQKLLRDYAESIGEDVAWLDLIFGGETSNVRPLIMHEPGHDTHIHVRFYNPIAQESGRRLYPLLVKHKKISPPTYYVRYKVKRGDTLSRIAKRYRTSIKALKRANGLRSTRIYANRTYKIPRKGGVRQATKPIVIPARRLPPPRKVAKPADPTGAARPLGSAAKLD
jgi:penicillin-insensitive murein endopeptidase